MNKFFLYFIEILLFAWKDSPFTIVLLLFEIGVNDDLGNERGSQAGSVTGPKVESAANTGTKKRENMIEETCMCMSAVKRVCVQRVWGLFNSISFPFSRHPVGRDPI
jgi:hypothetical protein